MHAEVDVHAAYRACEAITRAQARNFSYGIRLLPPPKRRMLSAVYAFARRIDDIGDGDLPPRRKLSLLADAEHDLASLPTAPPDDPVLVALANVAANGVDLAPFTELVDGCRDDVEGRSYLDIEQVYGYCRKVAGSIGRLSLAVFGTDDPAAAAPRADALAIALQLTNILRDVVEDRLNGRIYLPMQDVARFGCTLTVGPSGRLADTDDRLAALVGFEAGRAREWYAQGLALLPMLDRRSRACCAAMAGIYLRLLDLIEADPARVLRGRTSLPARTKAVVAASALLGRYP